MSGWTTCIAIVERIAFWLSGQSTSRITMPNSTSPRPYASPSAL